MFGLLLLLVTIPLLGTTVLWPWVALALLGALHGLNPGMGWLFAVALGMQQGERRAVWRALVPLTIGHALAIVAAVTAAGVLGLALSPSALRWGVITLLAVLGIRQLQRHRHPSAGGMRATAWTLVTWSFLVATAHGAGLMAVPIAVQAGALGSVSHTAHDVAREQERVPGASVASAATRDKQASESGFESHRHGGVSTATAVPARQHLQHAQVLNVSAGTLIATLVHTFGYILVTGLLAVVVYERAGLRILRRAWINVDRLWAISLLLAAAALAIDGGH